MPFSIKWIICSAVIFIVMLILYFGIRSILRLYMNRYKVFFRVLWIDLKAYIGDDVILPTSVEEALKFYPALPKFDECMKMPIKDLVSRISWTIDPRKHGLRISGKYITWRKGKP